LPSTNTSPPSRNAPSPAGRRAKAANGEAGDKTIRTPWIIKRLGAKTRAARNRRRGVN
jgi:hypothetical protein